MAIRIWLREPTTWFAATRDDKGNFVHKREINAFIEIPLDDRFLFNIMRDARTLKCPTACP
jgi:hypothetical protein